MNNIKAASVSDLLQILRKIDIAVPPRTTKGRDTKRRETWIICHFLATVSETALLEYPLHVGRGERPDFTLFMPSKNIGIEVVEAIPAKIAQEVAHLEHKSIATIPKGTTCRTPPRMGNSSEQGWIKAILDCSQLKADKFRKPGFKNYDYNWLLIYDNWCPAPEDEHIDTEDLSRQLFSPNWKNPFEQVFVLSSEAVCEFSNQAKPAKHPRFDL